MYWTPSESPTSLRSVSRPLKANAEVRAVTLNSVIFASTLRISSVIPSLKYSWSPSGLMSANGRTAIDGRVSSARSVIASRISGAASVRGASVSTELAPDRWPANQTPPNRAANPATASSPAGHRFEAGSEAILASSPGPACSVRRMPSGVTSSAQARTRVSGKPNRTMAVINGMNVSGSPKPSFNRSAIWSNTNDIAPYTAATLNTFRLFSSANSC